VFVVNVMMREGEKGKRRKGQGREKKRGRIVDNNHQGMKAPGSVAACWRYQR